MSLDQIKPNNLPTESALSKVVYKNHWREVFNGDLPDDWEPSLSVSVVIAAFNTPTLALTLASLAAQDYPQDLLEVIVVDDGSEPAVELGQYVPKNTRLIRMGETEGWGRSNAMGRAIDESTGDIIYWVDSDMILFRDNVRQHAKWAHFIPEAATIGHKGFVEEWDFTPEQVYATVSDGTIADFYNPDELHRHWSLDIFDRTDDLNTSDGRNYSTHMGACASVTRLVYDRTNRQDRRLHLGEDTEIAYQIWQAGGVFIPVNDARTWHLGRATIQDHAEKVAHHNDVYFAQRMPIPRYRRTADNRTWEVPFVRVQVEVDFATAEFARRCVDRVLNSSETDLVVDLVGPWSALHEERRRLLADPNNELYLVEEWFRTDGRVNLVEEPPARLFPSPYRIELPVTVGVNPGTIRNIIRQIDGKRLGKVTFFVAGDGAGDRVVAWSGAAIERSLHYVDDTVTLEQALSATWGVQIAPGSEIGLFDLRAEPETGKIVRTGDDAGDLRRQLEQERRALLETQRRLKRERRIKGTPVRVSVREAATQIGVVVKRGLRKVKRSLARGAKQS